MLDSRYGFNVLYRRIGGKVKIDALMYKAPGKIVQDQHM
jgi:hypothetical protein